MRISIVLLLCVLIAVINSATVKTTPRRVVVTTTRGTTKAPARKSAYAYLRTVRGKTSCASGTCPFWQRHGRSFAALRCYSEQYQDCVCLHRMCFSSCMFSRAVCNTEMVSCLRQICPRCMPPSASAMCAVYDSMATSVANALSVFACYPCCPSMNNMPGNSTGMPTITTTRPPGNVPPVMQTTPATGQATTNISVNVPNGGITTTRPMNGGNNGGQTNAGQINGGQTYGGQTNGGQTNGGQTNGGQTNGGQTNGGQTNGGQTNGGQTNGGQTNGGQINGGQINGGQTNGGQINGGQTNGGAVLPGSGNMANTNNNNNLNPNQRVQKTVRPTTRRAVTTRRTSATTRRASVTTRRVGQTTTTVRNNNIKTSVRTPVQAQKKPQTKS